MVPKKVPNKMPKFYLLWTKMAFSMLLNSLSRKESLNGSLALYLSKGYDIWQMCLSLIYITETVYHRLFTSLPSYLGFLISFPMWNTFLYKNFLFLRFFVFIFFLFLLRDPSIPIHAVPIFFHTGNICTVLKQHKGCFLQSIKSTERGVLCRSDNNVIANEQCQ